MWEAPLSIIPLSFVYLCDSVPDDDCMAETCSKPVHKNKCFYNIVVVLSLFLFIDHLIVIFWSS